jgi:tetratricopeptide (TPR) repeat protein
MIPIFTRKDKELLAKTDSAKVYHSKCEIDFIKPYIRANNDFLRSLRGENAALIPNIRQNVKKVIDLCPLRESEAKTILGSAYYHAGNLEDAQKLFLEAFENNKFNTLALLYLKDIYFRVGKKSESLTYLRKLKTLCPDAFPRLK